MNLEGENENEDRGDDLSPAVAALEGAAAEKAAQELASADAAKLAALQEGEVTTTTTPAKVEEEEEEPETPEEKAEREAEEARKAAAAHVKIPKYRVDEMVGKANAKADAALAELAQVKAQLAAATKPTVDELAVLKKEIKDLENQYEDHIIDGRKADAQALRLQLDAKREALMDKSIAQRTNAAHEQTIAQLTYDAELAKMEAKYPQMNPDSENHDPALEKEMGELMAVYMKAGASPTEALHQAAKYVMPKPAPAAAPAPKTSAAAVAEARNAAAKAKAAAAVKQQPQDISAIGKDSDKAGAAGTGKMDVMRMSQKDFAALDEKVLRQNRGDELE